MRPKIQTVSGTGASTNPYVCDVHIDQFLVSYNITTSAGTEGILYSTLDNVYNTATAAVQWNVVATAATTLVGTVTTPVFALKAVITTGNGPLTIRYLQSGITE